MSELDQLVGHTINGDQLNHILNGMPLVKFMLDDDVHYNMKYITGYNKNIEPFKGSGECSPGGIYITTLNNCNRFFNNYGNYAREVWVNSDTMVYVERNKLKCNEVWLGERKLIDELLKELFLRYASVCEPIKFSQIIESRGYLIRWVDPKIRTIGMRENAVKDCGESIQYIEKEYITHEMIMIAVKQNGNLLSKIDEAMITPSIVSEALKNSPLIAQVIGYKLWTNNVQKMFVKQNSQSIHYFHNPSFELMKIAIKQNGRIIIELHDYLISTLTVEQIQELRIDAIKQNGRLIEFIAPMDRTCEMMMAAVKQNGKAIQYIDPKDRTPEMIYQAVKQNGIAIMFIDKDDRTSELLLEALNSNGKAIRFIERNQLTDPMFKTALKQNPKVIKYFGRLYL